MGLFHLLGQGMGAPSSPCSMGFSQMLAGAAEQLQLFMFASCQLVGQPLDMYGPNCFGIADGLFVQTHCTQAVPCDSSYLGLGQSQAILKVARIELRPMTQKSQWFGVVLRLTSLALKCGTVKYAEQRKVDLVDMYRRAPGQLQT